MPEVARTPKPGEKWLNCATGQLYLWDPDVGPENDKGRWVDTGKYPYGEDPMGLLSG